MKQEERVQQIEVLIGTAKTLTKKPYNSPLISLWEDDVRRFLEDIYDEKVVSIFEDSISYGAVISSDYNGQQQHLEAMQRAIELLEGLKSKQPPQMPEDTLERAMYPQKKYRGIKQEKSQTDRAPQQSFYNYGGNIHTGYGNIEQQISIGDIILKIAEEIQQKIPESQEKKSALQALKSLTTNQTFAGVIGASFNTLLNSISSLPH